MSFAHRVRLAVATAFLLMAAAAALGAGLALRWWQALLLAAIVGAPLGWWILERTLLPAGRTLRNLTGGVRGYREGDFTLSLTRGRDDELGELVEVYNAVGDVLRDERSALLQKEMLLETVLEATPTAIVLANARDRVVFANRAAGELFAGEGALVGARFGAILERCPEEMRDLLARGQDALFSVPAVSGAVDGSAEATGGVPEAEEETYHVARRAFEIHGQRHHLYLIKRMTPELRRQEVEVWKRAIRTMSHELNNSLAPIGSLARSARRLAGDPVHAARLSGALEVIEERAAHLHAFLEGYARFARLPQPAKQEVDCALFLAELRDLVPFVLDGDPPTLRARFDPTQMQQVLINLLKNARESDSPPGEVRLGVERTAEGGVRFRVSDRGSGMSEEVLRKALLPFYSSKPSGSGLGLPLAREIVEAHGGRLRIERREGGGTAVVCWLPVE